MSTLKELVSQTTKLKLLYVEDNPELRDKVGLLLHNFFTKITIAVDGEDGLEKYKNDTFDIVITDIRMPKLNGVDMSREIKKLNPNQHIIILSGYNDMEYILDSIELDIEGYILKPFSTNEISNVLSKVVEKIATQKKEENYKKELQGNLSAQCVIVEYSKEELQEQKDRLETIFSTSKDGIAILDLETNFLDFNDAYLKMTGFTREELLTKSCLSLSLDKDIPKSKKVIGLVLRQGYYENYEKRCIVKDDKIVTTNMSLSLMPNKKEIVVSTRDVTESKKVKQQLKEYMQLIDKNIITSTIDLDGNFTHVSQAFCEICGYAEYELIGNNHKIIRDNESSAKTYEEMWEALRSSDSWRGEIRDLNKNGEYFWVDSSVFAIYDENHTKIGYTSIRHNITDKKCVEKLSITDSLTGLYNRRYFDSVFSKVINSSKRNKELLCFIMLDVDHFKLYNDKYGHQKGDEVLVSIAKYMKDSLRRSNDYSFRLGGEEFGILFKAENRDDAALFAKGIMEGIENLKIIHEENSASDYISVSIGLVCRRTTSQENQEDRLYKEVDDLLYRAKAAGRNKLVMNDTIE